ncbi:hypothetical protein QTH79_04910 [Clostridium perfringens]|nr:hypothetical protein [Clostridium perfringens]MDZ4993933.1 hypothetical protein [Clostridium perfringens]
MTTKEFFCLFKNLYLEKKIKILWKNNSYGISIKDNDYLNEENMTDFRTFIDKLVNYFISNGKAYEEFKEYINELEKEIPSFIEDIYVKFNSNLNNITTISGRCLSSKNNNNIEIKSALININYLESVENVDVERSLVLELSKQDIDELIAVLKELNIN